MGQLIDNVNQRIKTSINEVALVLFRLFSGVFLGFTLSMIAQEMMDFGTISFVFVTIAIIFLFMKLSKQWTAVHVLVFDLICVLIGLLLRMYILIAPGH